MGEVSVASLPGRTRRVSSAARAARGRRLAEPGEAVERNSVAKVGPRRADATIEARSSRALAAMLSLPGERLLLSQPNDASEREAERVAESVVQALSTYDSTSSGQVPMSESDGSIAASARRRFELHFGDLSDVRIHTDSNASESARNLGANAFTVGNDISFASGKYTPQSTEGRRILAHELAHVKSSMSGAGVLHRDLAGYTREHLEIETPMFAGPGAGMQSIFDVTSADASALSAALATLITAGKVGTATRGDLQRFWSSGATLAEVEAAFTAASFPRAHDMAVSLLDGSRIAVYSHNEKVYIPGLIWDTNISNTNQNVTVQTHRGLTNAERTAAQEVFGSSLNFDAIILDEDPIMSIGGYARTTPWEINLPVGSLSGGMSLTWLLHEMAHSWQYAHGVSLTSTTYHAIKGVYAYGGETELAARTARGQGLASFNTEQQADIAKDAYLAIHGTGTLAIYKPYIDEFHHGYK